MSERAEILVVEDDEDTRMVLQDLLELNGFAVRTSPDARHALDAAPASAPRTTSHNATAPSAASATAFASL